MSDLGELSISIAANSTRAGTAIDRLVQKLTTLQNGMASVSGSGFNTQMGQGHCPMP